MTPAWLGSPLSLVASLFDPVVEPRVRQGAVEQSNVDAVTEIARMIVVTRAYETAQSLIEDEDNRISEAIDTLGQNRA